MSVNRYSTLVSRLATVLTGLTGYDGLAVLTQMFRPTRIPALAGNYGIVISPTKVPWEERRTAIREVQDLYRLDLFLLVRNFNESDSLFGTTPGSLGLFQMISDVKVLLRGNDLDGLLDLTYDEVAGDSSRQGAGPVEIEEVASPGFDADEYTFVHRARLPFLGRMIPVIHPK